MNETILLVDDNPRLLAGARMALSMKGFRVLTAKNGVEALETLHHTRPALIVSDIAMPECDGFALLERVHSSPDWVTIPFLFLTAMNDPGTIHRSRELAADDFLTKPFSPTDLTQAVISRLERARAIESIHSIDAYLRTITILANAVEARDVYTGGHVERVAEYAQALARELGWPEEKVREIQLAAVLHDVGKITVPDAVLNKTEGLTPAEWEIMRAHPVRGIEILAPLKHSQIVLDGVRYHHERYDGQGYPDGLAGDRIPEAGRLIAIVDAYDAMTTDRAYRGGMTEAVAADLLRSGAGAQFDPHMVEVFAAWLTNHTGAPPET